MFKFMCVLVSLASVCHFFGQTTVNEFERNIYFNFYKNNSLVLRTNSFEEDLSQVCDTSQPWALIIHGWTENCSVPWVVNLIPKLSQYRGGCISCMDYYAYSQNSTLIGFFNLVSKFDSISDVLLKKLHQFVRDGFDPANGFVFGFSVGAQLAINAGRDFRGKLNAIDACDPAGPGFYPNPLYQARGSPKLAARNVQTIHTSPEFGTLERDSHQDWLMGICGIDQPGAPYKKNILSTGLEHDNHMMCPIFYVNSFENKFRAVVNDNCGSDARDVFPVPANYYMGYRQKDKGLMQGILYANTYTNPPYNTP